MNIKRIQSVILAYFIFSGVLGIANDIGDALTKGKASINLRYRFEYVGEEGKNKDAKASTIRIRLGYTTGKFHEFDFHMDMEAIRAIGIKDFNSTDNNKVDYPIVADPEDTELNQAFLTYRGIANTIFNAGRQRIKLDNDRFIGNVGWRQNEQTYDAFKLVNTSIPNTTITLVHIENVNRVFGEHHSSRSDIDLRANIIHFNYAFSFGSLNAYGHFLENQDVPKSSHRNLGLRFSGGHSVSKLIELLYAAEFATQQDFKDGSDFIDADYHLLELGCRWNTFTAKAGYEELGGNGDYSFLTPFATLHAFNGWADKFLSTPINGLVDKYILLSSQIQLGGRSLTLKAIYHDFKSDNNSIDYGTELDLLAQIKLCKECSLIMKYADYSAHDYAKDTKKFWIGYQYSF